jgi:hypothetical protein
MRGSSSGQRPVVEQTVAASRSESPISNGGPSTRITFGILMRFKRKSTERAPATSVSNQDGVSFLAELLDIRFLHELEVARNELVARDLIAYAGCIYQVLDLPVRSSEDVWLSKLGSPATLGT